MPSDASIYNNVGAGVTPLLSPYDVQAKQLAIQNALAAGQMTQLDLQRQRQAIADDQATRNAALDLVNQRAGASPVPASMAPAAPAPGGGSLPFDAATGMNPDPTGGAGAAPAPASPAPAPAPVVPPPPPVPTWADLIRRGVPPDRASALIQQFQKIDETSANIGKTKAEALKAQKEANDLVAQQASDMANMLVKTAAPGQPINPDLLQWHLQHFASLGPQEAAQAQQVGAQLARLAPADQVTFLQSLAGTPKTIEANAAADTAGAKVTDAGNMTRKTDAELPGITADSTTKQLTAAGKAPIQPAEQLRINQEAQNIAERLRHDKVEENNAAQNREAVQLTPQALDQMATMFGTTGQLPNLGMGAAVAKTRSAIINRAADLFPNVALASNAAAYQANKHSLNTVTGTLDTLSSFENAGLKNLKMFTDAAAKIPDTGVPWLNVPVRMLDEKLVGSTNMSLVNTARDVALREIARVTNDPKLSGVLSDSARQEVQGLSPKDATLPQIITVAKALQTDMANVHQSLQEQKDAITSRLASSPNGTGATSAPAAAGSGSGSASSGGFKVGDSVMYNGAAHKVTAIKPDGKLVLEN